VQPSLWGISTPRDGGSSRARTASSVRVVGSFREAESDPNALLHLIDALAGEAGARMRACVHLYKCRRVPSFS
jgi:hypothetical protein